MRATATPLRRTAVRHAKAGLGACRVSRRHSAGCRAPRWSNADSPSSASRLSSASPEGADIFHDSRSRDRAHAPRQREAVVAGVDHVEAAQPEVVDRRPDRAGQRGRARALFHENWTPRVQFAHQRPRRDRRRARLDIAVPASKAVPPVHRAPLSTTSRSPPADASSVAGVSVQA